MTKISDNFTLEEFGGVHPEPKLLLLLQALRYHTGSSIVITSGKRTVPEHITIYKQLETEGKIKTTGNGLGDLSLLDYIPWGSKHLPSFNTKHLRAADINCYSPEGELYTGEEIHDRIETVRANPMFIDAIGKTPLYLGIGVGKTYVHLDTDRDHDTVWGYGY